MVSGVSTDIFGSKKLRILGGIHETRPKETKLLGHLAVPSGLRPGLRAPLCAQLRPMLWPSVPGGIREVSILFFFVGFMKLPKVSIFAPKNIREIPEIIKKSMKPGHKKKCVVSY